MDLSLNVYIPRIEDLTAEQLQGARSRVIEFLRQKEEYRGVDMSPNSVFGDLVLGPLTHIMAAFELGAARMFSDLNLANVAKGEIYNCDFVKEYLNNYGLGRVYEYPSSGVVQMVWATHYTKYIDAGTKFLFVADGGEEYIYELANVADLLIIRSPYEAADPNNPDEIQLVRVAENKFIANLPVKGLAGVGVTDGTSCATDLGHPDLIGAYALGEFDRGTLPENVMELAAKAQRTFYSASLNNRSGAVSYVMQAFPEIRGVSPVVTGDMEMVRDRTNILGIKEGKMDIFMKGRTQYMIDEREIKLVQHPELGWVGRVTTNEPAVLIDHVRRHQSEVHSVLHDIYGRSTDEVRLPAESAAFSKFEQLGVAVTDNESSHDVTPFNKVDGESDTNTVRGLFKLTLLGTYHGGPFSPDYERTYQLRFLNKFQDGGVDKIRIEVRDTIYRENSGIFTLTQSPGAASKGVVEEVTLWDQLVPGIELAIATNDGAEFGSVLSQLEGAVVELNVRGRGALFNIQYRYDPNFTIVDKIVSHEGVAPVNSDVVLKNFLTCYVDELVVRYRRKEGQHLDEVKAREEITRYVNNLAYPYVYEEHTVAEVAIFYGAHGVQSVTQKGRIQRSLASKYQDTDTEGVYTYRDVVNPYTLSLHPEPDSSGGNPSDTSRGVGPRNINYILDSSRIKFDAIVI